MEDMVKEVSAIDVAENPAIYIPAASPIQLDVLLGKFPEKAKKLMWYLRDSFFYHPYMLTSAFYSRDWVDFREHFLVKKGEVEHWGDSGGFQAWTQKAIINPKDVVLWMQDNCEYGFALDDPGEYVMVGEGDHAKKDRVSSSEFEKSAQRTLENNEIYFKNRTSKDLKLYNVLHGSSLDQIEMWYNYVSQVPFEGWALGMKPVSDPVVFTFAAMYLYEKGVRENIHFFGVSGLSVIPIIIYMTRYFKHLTFDSTSYAVGAMYRRYLNPLNQNLKITIGNITKDAMYKKLPCDCPYCSKITNIPKLYEPGAFSGTLISMHNLYHIVHHIKLMNLLNQSQADYREYVGGNAKIMEMIEFIDMCVAIGFEKACQKYMWLLQGQYHLFDDESARWSFITDGLGLKTPEPEKKKKGKKEKVVQVEQPKQDQNKPVVAEKPSPKKQVVLMPMAMCDWL